MSPLPLMNHEELLELASLDALALLDDQDAALFERAFLAASEETQRQVREFQAAVATDPTLLADEEPGDALRLQVLSHLTAQMRRSKAELEPVALVAAGQVLPSRRRPLAFLRSALVWQAASFALFAGLVTSVTFYNKAVDEVEQMARNIATFQISDNVREVIGAEPWAVMGRAEVKVPLSSPDRSAVGTVFLDEGSNMLVVVAYGLPQSAKPPVLHVTDAAGNELLAVELQFAKDGVLRAGFDSLGALKPALLANAAFTVVAPSGEVLLS